MSSENYIRDGITGETMANANCRKKSVLFVCLGNICRSPMAEGIFMDLIRKRGIMEKWIVDSAAVTNFHVGKSPDKRTMTTLAAHGITNYEHNVRQVSDSDFQHFDYIFGMDHENITDLMNLRGNVKSKAIVEYLGKYDPEGVFVISDPFYSRGMQMFEKVYEQCLRCCQAFLEKNSWPDDLKL